MADVVKYFFNTEAQILALTHLHPQWEEKAFYYPSDKSYFYQIFDGVLKKYGQGDVSLSSVGVLLNNKIIGGSKNFIETSDILQVPDYFQYFVRNLKVDGEIKSDGEIFVMG